MDSINSRREFLKFISSQSLTLSLSPFLLSQLSGCTTPPEGKADYAMRPSTEDALKLADGLNYKVLKSQGDRINKNNDLFGDYNDFTNFLPLQGKTNEGLLWVNHESVLPEFLHRKPTSQLTRSINEVTKEQEMVGGSILHIQKIGDEWQHLPQSKYNRRLHGRSEIPFSGGFSIQGSKKAVGTLANCSGGRTPWNTFLTSEENYNDFYGEASISKGKRVLDAKAKYGWNKHFPLPPEHYGWIVEIDPMTGQAEKQILLGRAPHEGATVVTTKNNRVVVYMGEDREFGYIFKFVSEGANFKKGTLYAADTIRGRWLPLDINKDKKLQKVFNSQLQVLTYAHLAAETVGATPQDRPEDIEVHPKTGHVFVALTKNSKNNNPFGSLLKIAESGDHDAENFKASTWMSGGPKTGIACPDNLCFDAKGNLWVTNDMSGKQMKDPLYKQFGNNGLFHVPMSGPFAGTPMQIASAPTDAELTGPSFSPDYQTLFLSVQHPGSGGRFDFSKPTSQWPDGPGKLPRSSVVTIQGSLFKDLMA